jgi:hypothetical protein
VPAPDDSPPRQRISRVDDSLAQRLEMRLARGREDPTEVAARFLAEHDLP